MTNSDSTYFGFELLKEILLKLPVKSLIRFTIVCKLRYVRTHKREHYSLFQESKNRPFSLDFTSKLNYPFKCKKGYFKIVGSCNGIVCLYDELLGELRSLVLWNPYIHKFISIPLPSIKPQSPHMFVLGFGVDLSETDDYKLIREFLASGSYAGKQSNQVLVPPFRRDGSGRVYHMNILFGYNGPHEIEIYSINSRVWRRVVGVEIKHCMVKLYIGLRMRWFRMFVEFGVMSFNIADEVEIMLLDALDGVTPINLSIMLFEESLVVVNYGREIDGIEKVVRFRNNDDVLFSTRRTNLVSYDPNSGRNMDPGNNVNSDGFLGGMEAYGPNEQLDYKIYRYNNEECDQKVGYFTKVRGCFKVV
ncbi:hypothetical protein H5410_050645 [Solanum commersonii]|uniref:F-box associated beta-propeller type 1 domain-containing protein n=1 Tax=Solanum commersonii TaxID=4109 RepID=A0A9J5WW51_SOLCO|nr:hypothetical protein H5410_050645 [Solanum commersonii]